MERTHLVRLGMTVTLCIRDHVHYYWPMASLISSDRNDINLETPDKKETEHAKIKGERAE